MQSEKEMHISQEMTRISREVLVNYRRIACLYEFELRRERVIDCYFAALEER